MYKGSCLCGSIHYRIEGDPSDFGYCHCKSCQKASGSAHGANIGVRREDVRFDDPHGYLKDYESSPGKIRTFCGNCGSPLYAYLQSSPNLVRIRLGSLDTPLGKTAKAHTFVSEKADWEQIEGSLPQFEKWADKKTLVQVGSRQ